MAPLRLILRYREFNGAIDTVAEHNAIIREHGGVFWGWWRKKHEPGQEAALTAIQADLPIKAALLNRDARRLFHAEVSGVSLGCADVRRELVPEYYRDSMIDVAAWFEFRSEIEEVSYDGELASQIGGQTLLICNTADDDVISRPEVPAIINETEQPTNPVIVHLSDLHFGIGDHNFVLPPETPKLAGPAFELARVLADDVFRVVSRDPGVLIVSGDITTKSYWEPQFRDRIVGAMRRIAEGVRVPIDRVIVGPENHDFERALPDKDKDAA
jgi:hypothetical protein